MYVRMCQDPDPAKNFTGSGANLVLKKHILITGFLERRGDKAEMTIVTLNGL